MISLRLLVTLVILVVLAPVLLVAQEQSFDLGEFQEYAASSGLVYSMPDGFHEVPVRENPDLHYVFAVISPDSTFEVRYTVRPLADAIRRYEKCAEDENCTMVDPNRFYLGLAMANALNMSGGATDEFRRFPTEAVEEEFNAHAGGSSAFEFDCEFGEGYEVGQAIVLHKDNVADVVITFLATDIESLQKYLLPAFYTLVFSQES